MKTTTTYAKGPMSAALVTAALIRLGASFEVSEPRADAIVAIRHEARHLKALADAIIEASALDRIRQDLAPRPDNGRPTAYYQVPRTLGTRRRRRTRPAADGASEASAS